MTNVNQTNRPGNLFGTPFGAGFGNNGIDYALKPGFIVKARNNFYVIEAREALTVDLFFSETHSVTTDSNSIVSTAALVPYGHQSVTAMMFPDAAPAASSTVTSTNSILSPSYDSGYIKFDDLEPSFGHLYQLAPTLPFQPKYIDNGEGEFLITDGASGTGELLPSGGGTSRFQNLLMVLLLSVLFPQNCTSSIRWAPPSMCLTKLLRATQVPQLLVLFSVSVVSLDYTMSPIESPNWNYSLFIEHGENNLPSFKLCNDSEEYILDGRVRLTGWKYSIAELSMSQLSELQSKGKVTYAIINPQGIPTSSSLSGPFLK